jgi:hypothetical protein
MKKIGETILALISVLGLPGIIQLASKVTYDNDTKTIWILSFILWLLLSLTQLDIALNSSLNKFVRTARYYIFKTKNIIIFLLLQLIVILFLILENYKAVDIRLALISFGINIIGINLLILIGKIPNSDSKDLILHEAATGKMFLYSNNQLRHIPDPPTFDLLGLSWSEAIDISSRDLDSYKIKTPITSLRDMKLYDYRGRVYGLVNDKLKHVPDPSTLDFILKHRTNKDIEPISSIQGYKIDKPFEHTT